MKAGLANTKINWKRIRKIFRKKTTVKPEFLEKQELIL